LGLLIFVYRRPAPESLSFLPAPLLSIKKTASPHPPGNPRGMIFSSNQFISPAYSMKYARITDKQLHEQLFFTGGGVCCVLSASLRDLI